jgi:hypothetical protein
MYKTSDAEVMISLTYYTLKLLLSTEGKSSLKNKLWIQFLEKKEHLTLNRNFKLIRISTS